MERRVRQQFGAYLRGAFGYLTDGLYGCVPSTRGPWRYGRPPAAWCKINMG